MNSLHMRLASFALIAGMASGCGMQTDSQLVAQQVGFGDPEVVARRVLDLEARRLAGKEGAALSPDMSFVALRHEIPGGVISVLQVEDLATGTVRNVTDESDALDDIYPSANNQYSSAISPDGRWIVVNSKRVSSEDYELRVLRLDGAEERTLMTFFGPENVADWVEATGWSRDGTKVLALAWMRDGSTRLEMFSRNDGSRTLLRAFDWRTPISAQFSPDGRFVAYDFPPDEDNQARDLYLLSLQGGREQRLTNDESIKTLIGWSPDASAIYYQVEDRAAQTSSVWRLPMQVDRAAGPPTLVRRDIAGRTTFAMEGGRIVYQVRPDGNAVWTASLDLVNDRLLAPPAHFADLTGRFVNGAFFDWTPDGIDYTYVRRADTGRPALDVVLRSASGRGDERTIRIALEYLTGRMPFGEGAILLRGQVAERPSYGELLEVDLKSGAVTPIEDPRFDVLREEDFGNYRRFSQDMSVLFRLRESDEATDIVARNLDSGSESVLYRLERRMINGHPRIMGPSLSPDGTLLAFLVFSADATPTAIPGDTGSNELHVLPVTGGASRVVHTGWIGAGALNWTSDSRALVFRDGLRPAARGGEVWKVSVDGSSKALLFSMPDGLGGLRLSPDDRRVVFGGPVERRVEELWVLENLQETRAAASTTSAR